MDRVIYLAMSAADQYLRAQRIHANNLANVNSHGFKAELDFFTDEQIKGPGYQATNRPFAHNTFADLASGEVVTTGRDLDIAIQGNGWLAVQAPDGTERYTRMGSLRISDTGFLETNKGDLVLGNNGPIPLNIADQIDIGLDGTVSTNQIGAPASQRLVIDSLRLVNIETNNLFKGTDGLFRTRDGVLPEPDLNVRVVQRSLEGSNVNGIMEMINMTEMARNFEVQMKLMKSAEENDMAAAELIRSAR